MVKVEESGAAQPPKTKPIKPSQPPTATRAPAPISGNFLAFDQIIKLR